MTLYEEIAQSIERQFSAHSRTNLFYRHHDTDSQFLPESKALILRHKEALRQIDRTHQEAPWIDRMTDNAYRTFCRSNQFLDLRKEHIEALREVYAALWHDIIHELVKPEVNFDLLQRAHVQRLTGWLHLSNAFAKSLNGDDLPEVVEVVCAEYSAALQLQLLQIDLDTLEEPVLDIGCGEHAHLINYLRIQGMEAFGMDRLVDETPAEHLIRSDWMDYCFNPDSWGTIISNHSFALHFTHQNERQESDYVAYATKYMEILRSLVPGGSFYYAPSLPFIESYLPAAQYRVTHHQVSAEYAATKITRYQL